MNKLYLATLLLVLAGAPALADWYSQVTLTAPNGLEEKLQYVKNNKLLLFPTEEACMEATTTDEEMVRVGQDVRDFAKTLGYVEVIFSCVEVSGETQDNENHK